MLEKEPPSVYGCRLDQILLNWRNGSQRPTHRDPTSGLLSDTGGVRSGRDGFGNSHGFVRQFLPTLLASWFQDPELQA